MIRGVLGVKISFGIDQFSPLLVNENCFFFIPSGAAARKQCFFNSVPLAVKQQPLSIFPYTMLIQSSVPAAP
jgi:hypothetical protein